MVRIAATGDLHIRTALDPAMVEDFASIHERADALIVAGDITNGGKMAEAELAAELFRSVRVPLFAVLGNHDRRQLRRAAFCKVFEDAGATMLEGEAGLLVFQGVRIGLAGVGGSGGGFWPDEGPPTPANRTAQRLAVRARREAARLDGALMQMGQLEPDMRIVVTHFAPTCTTLGREPLAKYWLLGNCELGRVIDRHPVDLVVHGHAHLGSPNGRTLGGKRVHNVTTFLHDGIVTFDLSDLLTPVTIGSVRRTA